MAETIAWCSSRASVDDPANSLRTPDLLPRGLRYSYAQHSYTCLEPQLRQKDVPQLQVIVNTVAGKRAERLREQHQYPEAPANSLQGGLLLFYDPYENLEEGSEEDATNGWFDLNAVPPWDTWMFFVKTDADRSVRVPPWYDTWLVCWVPSEFVELAHAGLITSTTDCILWADELDNSFLKELREAGIIPPQTNENLC